VKTSTGRILSLLAFALLLPPPPGLAAEPPQTVAEKTGYRATSRHADVVDFCRKLAETSPLVRLGELGTSGGGRKLPLVILADPPVATAAQAARSKKLVVFAMANIHAGEVDGKEAVLMLARDLTGKERPLLKDLIVVLAPIFNADGNERIAKTNRPRQAGPVEGVGVRFNSQGLDLNRDFVKLESSEVRALVRFLNQWDPAVFIDCHTTNGSYHRYTITYEGGRCPAGNAQLIAYVRDRMLPDVTRRLAKSSGYLSYFYGIISRDRRRWETVPAIPRYGIHYVGLRGRIAILSESYTYAPFKDRVLATRAFLRSILEYTAEHRGQIRRLLEADRNATVRAGKELVKDNRIVLRQKAVARGRPHDLLGFVEETRDGRLVPTDKPKVYPVEYWGGTEPTLSVPRPYGYLVPADLTKVIHNLQRHGIAGDELREDIELDVEVYRVDKVTHAPPFQKHQTVSLDATARRESRRVPAGTVLVRTAQPLGSLAAYLLEPQSADGLAAWNFFDAVLKKGKDVPVLRLPAAAAITTGPVRPLPEDRVRNKPITVEALFASRRPLNFNGSPLRPPVWLDDGEHFLQRKEGRLYRVHARTGRCHPLYDPDKLARGLRRLPAIGAKAADSLARSPALNLNPQHTGALFEHEGDLYYCNLDGTGPVRLTKTPGKKELASFSPDGKFMAFVRGNNLHVVDVATQTERPLTTDGSGLISNGRADWVYFEEIFHRTRQAYWWSPDSSRLAFLRYDDTPVHTFTVIDQIPTRQIVEVTPYPKAGDPNPRVQLGTVSVGGGAIHWADLGGYSETGSLLLRAGWTPDARTVWFYVQNRSQTWLDVCTVGRDGGRPTRLFRETTKAWVDDPGPPTFLKDGSFLLPSERTGWRHLYHFAKDGKLLGPVTHGDWEVRTLHRLGEEQGWVYFSGTRDSPIGLNLYRVKLDGGGLERLTKAAGEHMVSVGPRCRFFTDAWSDHTRPIQTRLYRADGAAERTLDTNPVYTREKYRFGKYELVRIKTPDGFELEGSLLLPADFNPARRYPVWFMTYAGPHAAMIRDNWSGGRVYDEALAHMGFIVFHSDPRSASGKGACSAWTAYRRLGVQELKDIETVIRWLTARSYVDPARVGMSGGSYGGFITSFALTHSKLFAAGVATAPVTDWHNYDSIYTERYMNTPQENPEGYRETSVVRAAKHLHGKLLLVHGLMDDNVHVQNSVQLTNALQRAGKDFEMMFYARARHGGFGKHYMRLAIDFMRRTLRPGS
jgi:dipeptidyl aminopeptidase/acylaminoacyl peptidase/murein tripeptide amidase MpaA